MQPRIQIPSRNSRARRIRRRALLAGTLLSICIARTGQADAQVPQTLDVSACDGRSRERLQWLVERLDSREFYADLWWRGLVRVLHRGHGRSGRPRGVENDGGQRADLIVSAVKAARRRDATLLLPAGGAARGRPLRTEALPDRESCAARVAQGEALLRQAAQESQQRWSWKGHVFNVGVNLAGALIVTQAFHQKSGWTSMGVGIAVGEAMLWSHPWQGKSDLEEYEARFAFASPPHRAGRWCRTLGDFCYR